MAVHPTDDFKYHRERLLMLMQRFSPHRNPECLHLEGKPRATRPPSFSGLSVLGPELIILIQAALGWEGQSHRAVRAFCQRNGVVEPTDVVLDTILIHEVGHVTICPKDVLQGKRIRIAVARTLKALDKYSPGLTLYTANLIADILVNVKNGHLWGQGNSSYAGGLYLFWYDQGASPYYKTNGTSWLRSLLNFISRKKRFSPLFEVFTRSQAPFLTHTKDGYQDLMKSFVKVKHPPGKREISPESTERDWEGLTREKLSIEEAAERIARLIQYPRILTDESEWPVLAHRISAILAPFLPEDSPPRWKPHPYFEYHTPEDAYDEEGCELWPPEGAKQENDGGGGKLKSGKGGISGEGEGGESTGPAEGRTSKEKDRGGESTGTGEGDEGQDENRQPPKPGTPSKGPLLGNVPWVSPAGEPVSLEKNELEEVLDAFYLHRASRVSLDFRSSPEQSMNPVEYYSPLKPPFERINGMEPLTSMLFCIDGSGSMMLGERPIAPNIPWMDGSYFHNALVAVYSVVKWLQNEQKDYQINVLTFSNKTKATDWFHYNSLREKLRDTVFNPEIGGTELDVSELEENLPSLGGCLILLFSDGELVNTQEVIGLFSRPDVALRCLPVLFHTNSEDSDLASAIRSRWPNSVIDIRHPSDLPKEVGQEAANLLG